MKPPGTMPPMQCSYPATPPSVGDYLTVADTSPQPAAGQANYVVTAVTNGTQRRYGRKLINGVMSGPGAAAGVSVSGRAQPPIWIIFEEQRDQPVQQCSLVSVGPDEAFVNAGRQRDGGDVARGGANE